MSQPATPERRQAYRYSCEPQTYCRLIVDGVVDFWALRVQNISAGGVKLLLDIPIPNGKVLSAILYNPSRRYSCQRQVRAIYSRRLGKCQFIVGGGFTKGLSAQEMNELL